MSAPRGRKPGPGPAIFCRAENRLDLDYTARQMDILNGDIPFEKIQPQQLKVIMTKAKAREDDWNYDIAKAMYDQKMNPDNYFPKFSVSEAKIILQKLTPWTIDWLNV